MADTLPTTPKWKRFEQLVADIQKDLAPEGFVVTPNDKILGQDTETMRQIDVSIRGNIGQFEMLMILEAKDYNVPVDVPTLEAFMGLAKDVRAQKAGMVSASGFSKATKTAAAKSAIDLYTIIDTDDHEWKKTLSLPAVCDVTELLAYQVQFETWSPGPFSLSAAALMNPRAVVLHDQNRQRLGTIDEFLHKSWWSGDLELEEGSHDGIEIVPNPVFIEDAEIYGRMNPCKLTVTMHVKKTYYHGEVPLKKARGLHNAITGRANIVVNMTMDDIEFDRIKDEWQPIEDLNSLAVEPIIYMRVLGMR